MTCEFDIGSYYVRASACSYANQNLNGGLNEQKGGMWQHRKKLNGKRF